MHHTYIYFEHNVMNQSVNDTYILETDHRCYSREGERGRRRVAIIRKVLFTILALVFMLVSNFLCYSTFSCHFSDFASIEKAHWQ